MTTITIDAHFIQTVRQMRKVQRRYFIHRSPLDLREAKKLEGQVDEQLAAIEKEIAGAAIPPAQLGFPDSN